MTIVTVGIDLAKNVFAVPGVDATGKPALMRLSGGGPTTAGALVATVSKGHDFACGRQFCAWLGLVPGQYGCVGKQRLGRITKAADPYPRTLLILDAIMLVDTSAGVNHLRMGHASLDYLASPCNGLSHTAQPQLHEDTVGVFFVVGKRA